jgi:hypothetical protein
LRRETRPGRAAGDFDVMPPGTTAGGPPLAAFWPARIAFLGDRIIISLIPITAPFVHILTNVIKPERVRRILGYGFRPILPAFAVIG